VPYLDEAKEQEGPEDEQVNKIDVEAPASGELDYIPNPNTSVLSDITSHIRSASSAFEQTS